jgi:DNA-binding response OmpR family regulator
MEPMNGIELAHEIRTNALSSNRMVPIVLITGYSALSRVAQARDAGVTEFLVKPFSANDLAKRIAYVINKPRDFIDSHDYFGPDRRRRQHPDYKGPFRREDDNAVDVG